MTRISTDVIAGGIRKFTYGIVSATRNPTPSQARKIHGDGNAALRTSRALAQLVYSVLKGVERLGDVLASQGG